MNRTHGGTPKPARLTSPYYSFAATDAAVADLMQRAKTHIARGELNAAAHQYKKVLAVRPHYSAAMEQLAEVHLQQGKREKASAEYAEFVRAAPQTLTQFDNVVATLKRLVPELASELADIVPNRNGRGG